MTPVVEIRGLRQAYSAGSVLDGLDLVLHEGTLFGVIGANGSGKTTLLNVISGIVSAQRGSIRVAGQEVSALPMWKRATRGIGRSFQDSTLWRDLSVREHLQVAAENRVDDGFPAGALLEHLTGLVELANGLMHHPPGALRLLDRRRLELVLAASHASNLLLVDEIGAGLDIAEAGLLYSYIEKLVHQRQARAAIMVDHKLGVLAKHTSRVGLLQEGRFVATASSDDPARYNALIDRAYRPGLQGNQ